MTKSRDPRVTVITPVFDRAAYVADAVRSVLEQTLSELEHIVIDDGSTDDTVRVLRELAASDDRVRLVEQSHLGPSAARNRGLAAARGRFVAFLDSDDLMPPGRLERQLSYLEEHPEVDAVFGTEEKQFTPDVVPPSWALVPVVGPQYCWSTVMLERKRLLAVGGFDEGQWRGEDTDLSFRLQRDGVRWAALDEVFLVQRFFGDNLTYDLPDPATNLLGSIRRHLARGSGPA